MENVALVAGCVPVACSISRYNLAKQLKYSENPCWDIVFPVYILIFMMVMLLCGPLQRLREKQVIYLVNIF